MTSLGKPSIPNPNLGIILQQAIGKERVWMGEKEIHPLTNFIHSSHPYYTLLYLIIGPLK